MFRNSCVINYGRPIRKPGGRPPEGPPAVCMPAGPLGSAPAAPFPGMPWGGAGACRGGCNRGYLRGIENQLPLLVDRAVVVDHDAFPIRIAGHARHAAAHRARWVAAG